MCLAKESRDLHASDYGISMGAVLGEQGQRDSVYKLPVHLPLRGVVLSVLVVLVKDPSSLIPPHVFSVVLVSKGFRHHRMNR